MIDRIEYGEFIGSVHYSAKDDIMFGKIEGINDLVTFEGASVKELRKAFKEAVDDYVALCAQAGKDPFKSFKGSFNIRIPADMHKELFRQATKEGKNLNQFVQEAIQQELLKKQSSK